MNEISQSQRDKYCVIDSIYMHYLEQSKSETENIIGVTRGWQEGATESCYLMGIEFQFCRGKRIPEIDGWW